jgi:hypothetical protein
MEMIENIGESPFLHFLSASIAILGNQQAL